jgi:hypothetical protein
MSLLQMMVSKLSWKEQIACESRRQPLADSPSLSRSSDQLRNVADTLSTLARVLDPLGGRESCLHGPGALFVIAQHRGEITQVTYQLLPWISKVLSLPLRYDSLSIKCWSRWSKTHILYHVKKKGCSHRNVLYFQKYYFLI